MIDAFAGDPQLARAILASLLVGPASGVLGTLLVLRRQALLSGGLSHAAFGGIGLCHFLGWPYQVGGFAVAAVASLILGPMGRERAQARDALIGVLWAAGMAAGVLFIHLTPGYPPDLGAFLFGNLLLVLTRDLVLLAALDLVLLVLLAFFFKDLVAFAFDSSFAAVQGVPVRLFSTTLLLLTSLAVVLLLPVVGLLLVLALLSIPALISLRLTHRLETALGLAVVLAVGMNLAGLGIAYALDLPPGPAIVLPGTAALALVEAGHALAGRRLRKERG